jgi:hypothetical protein
MLKKLTLALSAAAMGLVLTASGAWANPAPSRDREESSREQTLRRIHNLLDHQVARDRLAQLGIDRADLEKRMERLNDRELEELSRRLDSIGVGGDAGLTTVIALLVIVALVLLIIYLAERTA